MRNSPTKLGVSNSLRTLRSRRALVLAGVTLCLTGCGRRDPEIDLDSVERVVTALSADELLGRAAFTPGLDQAADFIRDEFALIGLETFGKADDYLQRFIVYSLQIQSHRVILNGIEIPNERIFVDANVPSVHWVTGNPVEVVVFGPEEDPARGIARLRRGGADALVLMSPEHEAFFRRFRTEVSDAFPLTYLNPPSGPTLVGVLTDEMGATSFQVDVTGSVEQRPLTNVVGMIPGRRDDEIVLFGASYDGPGLRDPVDGDSVVNGANDGAAGTTAMIELARLFKAKGEPGRTLVFAALTGEHVAHLGAGYLSRQLDPERIVAMLAMGPIGKVDPNRGLNAAYVTGFDLSDLGAILRDAVKGTPYVFYPDPYPDQYLFRRATNAPFACFGVPAHAIGTGSTRDEDFHRVSDEVETLDLVNMTGVMQAIALGVTPIISGEATPTRIDPPLRDFPCER